MPSPADDTPDASAESSSPTSVNSSKIASPPTLPASDDAFVSTQEQKSNEDISADENPFDNEASRALFNAIDEIATHGERLKLEIPQLIVVGGQSTGKSSLLQTLTKYPFPIGAGCCTRFATRIVSSRAAPGTKGRVKITIVPPDIDIPGLRQVPRESYTEFSHIKESFTAEEFADIVEEASTKYMKINPGRNGANKKNFAAEVLKVEITGPNCSEFSILDIPGLFTNSASVKEGEMNAVTEMVEQYMRKRTNIVICIAAGNNDIADQGIFELARNHVEETRLIGVFTKCDRLTKEEIQMVVAHANGKVEDVPALKRHGWFVVRNQSAEDEGKPGFDPRQAEMDLFEGPEWSGIDPSRKGSMMLRRYLGKVLCRSIQDAFPNLTAKIRQRLEDAQSQMKALGEPRASHEQRRSYLADIAQDYEEECAKALSNPWQLDVDDAMVRFKIRALNDTFDKLMREKGYEYEFEDHGLNKEDCLQRMRQIVRGNFPEQPKESAFIAKIQDEVKKCSSTELPGMVHPEVIQRLYKVQTRKWREMAEMHLLEAATIVRRGAKAVLEMVCSETGGTALLHQELWEVLANFHETALNRAKANLWRYCEGDQAKPLQTTDPEFAHKLRLLKTLRVFKSFEKATMAWHDNKSSVEQGEMSAESVGALLYDAMHSSSTSNTVNDVHDTLKVYYEFSLQSFIRYIVTNIVEDFLGYLDGPLKGLTRRFVEQLPVAEIDRLAQEPRETAEKRQELKLDIKSLLAAEKCARLAIAKASMLV
ncbi:P-loop containing nucleoside triphosphate hydrolase protein [Stachybotrys elegans]|uniref:P-loop containing nucleoside triphosphate hydrolase protein n=1 Tax=Stachybotrys elegans TaxID=80388 RepID=A0A8K0WL69_9HYPO|nr:P-loop containing nucleoside triphosphate hydrolase protein [Stachybotrys elegans]